MVNRQMVNKKRLLFILFCLLSLQGWAWGPKGHRIVAEVAYRYMSHKAIKQVDAILGRHGMVYYAAWADEIRSDQTLYPDSYDWHFQDLDAGLSDSLIMSMLTDYPAEGGNLYRKSDSLIAVLRENPKDRDALLFTIHLNADRFCPMHQGHVKDLGGNKVRMKWFDQPTNLHKVWDENLINSQGWSYTEYASKLINVYGSHFKQINETSMADWTIFNYHVTQAIYQYQAHFDGNTYHYIYDMKATCEWQLYVAGVKLAALLNEIYK